MGQIANLPEKYRLATCPTAGYTMNRAPVLFLNVLVMATCGLVYELLAGTLASYVLGDSVTQFSLVIGIYLFAMGVGAWLSRFIDQGLVRCFVEIEFGVAARPAAAR